MTKVWWDSQILAFLQKLSKRLIHISAFSTCICGRQLRFCREIDNILAAHCRKRRPLRLVWISLESEGPPPRTFSPPRTTSLPNFIPIRPAVWISIENTQTVRHLNQHCPLFCRWDDAKYSVSRSLVQQIITGRQSPLAYLWVSLFICSCFKRNNRTWNFCHSFSGKDVKWRR